MCPNFSEALPFPVQYILLWYVGQYCVQLSLDTVARNSAREVLAVPAH